MTARTMVVEYVTKENLPRDIDARSALIIPWITSSRPNPLYNRYIPMTPITTMVAVPGYPRINALAYNSMARPRGTKTTLDTFGSSRSFFRI